jgi:hypothetical protein
MRIPARYRSDAYVRHFETLIGEVGEPANLKRMTPSELEQKPLTPVLLETGVATTTYSLHTCCRQVAQAIVAEPVCRRTLQKKLAATAVAFAASYAWGCGVYLDKHWRQVL